jgi:hypothetical protein
MSKEIYHTLCQTEESIPLFLQDWWLDAACGKANWDVLLIGNNRGVQAAWPLYLPHPNIATMPAYTQALGIWFAQPVQDAKYATALEQRQALCKELLSRLHVRVFLQNFIYAFTDWLPFYWNGYRQTTRYTYLLYNLKDMDRLWQNMHRNLRRNIRKAEEDYRITVRKGISVDEFLRVQALTFERQHKKNKQSEEVLRRLIGVSRMREQGDLWGGYDEAGQLHAAVFVVWQKSCAHYIAGGGDPALRASGAHAFVLWDVIRFVSAHAEKFDFDGSMLPGVERFFREFGAIQTPYFTISRGTLRIWDRIRLKLKRRLKE